MKQFLAVLAVAVVFLGGCKTASAPTPIAPGYYSTAEQSAGEAIAAAQAVVLKYEADTKAGTYVPTAAMKDAATALQKALAIADPLALAWHSALATNAAAPEPAALASAVSTLNTNISALPKVIQ
jgi:hypothetical protein